MRKTIFAALLAFLPVAAHPAVLSKWVQYGPGGAAEVRAVIYGIACPTLLTDKGERVAMTIRSLPDGDFKTVCSMPVPPGTTALTLGGEALPLPVADPKRILVFGDTGCRVENGVVQDCNDPAKWPFPQIAAEATKQRPDLVIHVGDYFYRENACPADAQGCAGSPHGDNWQTWDADFFTPAQPLLAAAPWIFVRGNHEDCFRGGPGWLRLLGPLPFDPKAPCQGHLAPYAVPVGTLNLVVMDDANAPDTSAPADLIPVYRKEIAGLASQPSPTWLLLHRPIWAAAKSPFWSTIGDWFGLPAGGNQTIIAAVGNSGIPSPVSLMLAGHIHSFETINYQERDRVPPQIVAGFGGDRLDPTASNLNGDVFAGDSDIKVKDGMSLPGFGFLMMVQTQNGWRLDVHDVNGALERQCLFRLDRIDCPR
jgi:hypothetical protein